MERKVAGFVEVGTGGIGFLGHSVRASCRKPFKLRSLRRRRGGAGRTGMTRETVTSTESSERPENEGPGLSEEDGEEKTDVRNENSGKFDDGEEDGGGRSEIPPEDVSSIRLIFGSETFFATEVLSPPGGLVFRGNLRGEPAVTLSKLEERLSNRFGDKYTICLAEGEDDLKPVVVVVPALRDSEPSSTRQRQTAVAALLACMIGCVCRVGYGLFGVDMLANPRIISSAVVRYQILPLAFGILGIVLLGCVFQRFVAQRHNTVLSPPVLLPSYAFGSFGSITSVRNAVSSRGVLFDVAFSGAGLLLVLSLLMFIGGLFISANPGNVLVVPSSVLTDSMLLSFVTKQIMGAELLRSASRDFVGLHWLAVLGANCSMIAALNLLPIRHLDGGRMVAALFGRKMAVLGSRVTVLLLLMSTPHASHLLFFLGFVLFGPWVVDRPARNELTEPGDVRAILGLSALCLMMLVLIPKPTTMLLY
mmetsp:Transcript_40975/g.162217  ORF Transcript_40975/g.162217 Transcript_40975/m.162217 type:complete len:477 (-) Transcript_40975:3247-4677(-)